MQTTRVAPPRTSSRALLRACSAALAMCLLAEPSLAQHTFQRTLTVDPSGNADFTTIQAAINSPRIGSDPSTRFTVLIYPGT